MKKTSMEKNRELHNHSRYYSISARFRRVIAKIKRSSDRFDDWCDQSIEHYIIVFGVVIIGSIVTIGFFVKIAM